MMEVVREPQAPAGFPVASDLVLRQYREQHGLKLAFRPGEIFPWKGINFRVSEVQADSLTLVPVSMTSRRAKERRRG
jgi:hypothetical protein